MSNKLLININYCVHCKSNNIEAWIVEDRGFGNNQYYWCNDCDQET